MNKELDNNYINKEDIIVGISTSYADGAISIIRLSGSGSIELCNKVFKGCNLTKKPSHTIHHGYIINNSKEVLDEVLVSIFRSPKTYTLEDIVEINCHGGLFVTNQVYELLIEEGARCATPGEFTKRAFLNGRIDLTEAESVMDIIRAENKASVSIATKGILGQIRRKVEKLREELLEIIAVISVNIDYPEYDDVEMLTTEKIIPSIISIKKDLDQVLENSKSAIYIKNGINTVILGKPNVGKSSLLNAMVEKQKAIVTSIPGTTRDIIEEKINLGTFTLNLIDTAGIRDTDDVVEKIGVEKSINAINDADLILFMVDGSVELSKEDFELLNIINNKLYITIINKKDLNQVIDVNSFDNPLIISTSSYDDIELLKERITTLFKINNITNQDITYISNARQIEKFRNAKEALEEAIKEINDSALIDFVDVHLRKAWLYLGEIIGETSTESLIDELFSKFCLGK